MSPWNRWNPACGDDVCVNLAGLCQADLLGNIPCETVLATDLPHAWEVVDLLIWLQLRDTLGRHKTVIPDQVTTT